MYHLFCYPLDLGWYARILYGLHPILFSQDDKLLSQNSGALSITSTLGKLNITLNICFTVLIFLSLPWTTLGLAEKKSTRINSNLILLTYPWSMWTLLHVSFSVFLCTVFFSKSFYFGSFRAFFFNVFFNITWEPHPSCFKFQPPPSCPYSTMNIIMYSFNYVLFYCLRWYYLVSITYYIFVYSFSLSVFHFFIGSLEQLFYLFLLILQ